MNTLKNLNHKIINKLDELDDNLKKIKNSTNTKSQQNIDNNSIKISGYIGAIFTLFIFFIISSCFYPLFNIDVIAYYWLCFTILTGIWEYTYVNKKKYISLNSKSLLHLKEHVWFKKYSFDMILPHNTSIIFYSEYAAYADREYMNKKDNWSVVIEGSHCILCAIFSLFSLYFNFNNNHKNFYITMSISMGTQLMNSILYISEYLIQCKNPSNVNYNNPDFPTGKFFIKRPFMYINIFWTIMPLYILFDYMLFN